MNDNEETFLLIETQFILKIGNIAEKLSTGKYYKVIAKWFLTYFLIVYRQCEIPKNQ